MAKKRSQRKRTTILAGDMVSYTCNLIAIWAAARLATFMRRLSCCRGSRELEDLRPRWSTAGTHPHGKLVASVKKDRLTIGRNSKHWKMALLRHPGKNLPGNQDRRHTPTFCLPVLPGGALECRD